MDWFHVEIHKDTMEYSTKTEGICSALKQNRCKTWLEAHSFRTDPSVPLFYSKQISHNGLAFININQVLPKPTFLVATLHPALSVRPLVGRSVCRSHYYFFMNFIFWPHCSCPNDLVTSNMAPAHPHATGVAVYPALFISVCKWNLDQNSKNKYNLRY